jgi:hypothetical protein
MSGKGVERIVRATEQLKVGPVLVPRWQLPTLFALVLFLVILSACERADTTPALDDDVLTQHYSSPIEQLALAKAHDSQAAAAFEAKNFALCEAAYAASARLGIPSMEASSWHLAAQCAARRGDFRTGLFHLHAAASAGFDDYLVVIGDPLMRPLHSDARWTLVLDLIRANYLRETPLPIPGASIESDTQEQPKLS